MTEKRDLIDKELAALRGRVEVLERQVTDVQPTKPTEPAVERRPDPMPRMEPRGATITRVPDRNPSFVMPSGDELRRLHEIVLARYPQLATRSEHAEDAFVSFCRAFLRIAHLGRDNLNDEFFLTSWVDDAAIWLRDHQVYPSTLTARDFVAAVLAHGDIDFVSLGRFPYDCGTFGLRRDRTGRPATDGWRAILPTGHLRQPVSLPRSTVTARPPTQIAAGRGG